MSERDLTGRQLRFAQAYAGNGTEAARLAGYTGDDEALSVTASKLLRHPKVAALIRDRENEANRPLIATRHDRQAFWTKVMQDTAEEMPARLRASELLGKSEADFVDRLEHGGSVAIQVINPYAVKPGDEGG